MKKTHNGKIACLPRAVREPSLAAAPLAGHQAGSCIGAPASSKARWYPDLIRAVPEAGAPVRWAVCAVRRNETLNQPGQPRRT